MSNKALDVSFNVYLRKRKKKNACFIQKGGWVDINKAMHFKPGLILTGPATVLFPTADAAFSNVSEKAVTHKQEQISLACRKGKLLAEISLQMLGFQREELVDGEGLLACPAPPFPPSSAPFILPTTTSWVLLGPCWA